MRTIDADALTEFLKCLLPERGMWKIEGDTVENAVCETVAEAIEMVKNMETIQPEKAQLSKEGTTKDTISRQAVKHLDLFTKTFCRDKSVKDDLVFRCKQCEFGMPDGKCLVKVMARKLCPDYKDFGAMGDL